MIKSSCIHLKEVNKGKGEALGAFALAYRNAVAFYVKYYFSLHFKNLKGHMDPNALKQWTFYPYNPAIKSILSARALKCAKNQAMGLIKATTKQQCKRVYVLSKSLKEGKSQRDLKHLLAAINRTRITKPKVPLGLPMELNSIIMSCSKSSTTWDLAFDFSALFNKEHKKRTGF